MPDYLGADQRKVKEEKKEDKPIQGKIEYKKDEHILGNCVMILDLNTQGTLRCVSVTFY